MGIEHYFVVAVKDEDFFPDRMQIEKVLELFQKYQIFEQSSEMENLIKPVLDQLKDINWENGTLGLENSVRAVLPIKNSFWMPMIKDLKFLPNTIGGFDPEPKMVFFSESVKIMDENEESPDTRFFILEQSFGRGDVFEELLTLIDRFFKANRDFVEDVEKILGKKLYADIMFA